MKVIKIKYIIFGLCAIVFSLSSCSSDKDYDVKGNPDNLVYFKANANNTLNCSVIHTPVGDFGDVDAKFAVKIQRPASLNTTIIAEVDTSLIATYNTKNNTSCKAVPSGLVDQSKMTVTILKDSVNAQDSIEFSIPESKLSLLTDRAYLIPVRITEVKGDGKGSEERGIGYVVITTSTSLINDNPVGLLGKEADPSGWKCISADGLDANAFETENWLFTQKQQQASFVVDLGATHKVSGYLVASDVMTDGNIEVSEDNNTWTTLGSLTGHTGVNQQIGWYSYTWYVLYGGISARYVKVTMDLNTGYWGWDYLSWGECFISKFGLTYDE